VVHLLHHDQGPLQLPWAHPTLPVRVAEFKGEAHALLQVAVAEHPHPCQKLLETYGVGAVWVLGGQHIITPPQGARDERPGEPGRAAVREGALAKGLGEVGEGGDAAGDQHLPGLAEKALPGLM